MDSMDDLIRIINEFYCTTSYTVEVFVYAENGKLNYTFPCIQIWERYADNDLPIPICIYTFVE